MAYQRVGEATEVALRVLAEKIGLAGYSSMPGALSNLSRRDRATFCNDYWQQEYQRVRGSLAWPAQESSINPFPFKASFSAAWL
jgi:hypothetical protein